MAGAKSLVVELATFPPAPPLGRNIMVQGGEPLAEKELGEGEEEEEDEEEEESGAEVDDVGTVIAAGEDIEWFDASDDIQD